jgi:hypothetical protein
MHGTPPSAAEGAFTGHHLGGVVGGYISSHAAFTITM